jgi:RimJ/RimL family protein N-acetyltransferase
MGGHIAIRFLQEKDALDYSGIRRAALETEEDAFGSSPQEHAALTINDIAGRITFVPSEKFVVGAFIGERLVGTAGFFRNQGLKERHKGQIWGVYLAREVRGKSVGKQMLRLLLDRATTIEGLEQIKLAVATTQRAAVSLYRSLGFESFGLERGALKIGDKYIDEEHMVLNVRRQP